MEQERTREELEQQIQNLTIQLNNSEQENQQLRQTLEEQEQEFYNIIGKLMVRIMFN